MGLLPDETEFTPFVPVVQVLLYECYSAKSKLSTTNIVDKNSACCIQVNAIVVAIDALIRAITGGEPII